MTIVTLAITAILIATGATVPATPKTTVMLVEPTYNGDGSIATPGAIPPSETMDAWRLSYIMDYLEAREAEAKRVYERALKVWQIDGYLAGSPMRGLGECIVANAERTGVNAYLCPAIATAESSNGVALCGSFNAWGMLGCSFSSWQHGVQRFFDNIVVHWGQAQTSWELNGYCVPDEPWQQNVDGVARAISQREGFGGGGSSAE